MSWFKLKAQPKDERPPLQGYGDQLEGCSGKEADPPQGGSVIAHPDIFPLGRSGASPYWPPAPRANPSIITEYGGRPPRPRVDLDLIGDYYQ